MGNSRFKKEQAEIFNRKRKEDIAERKRIAQDKIDNPEKYKRRTRTSRKAQAFISTAMTLGADNLAAEIKHKEDPVLIENWDELAKVEDSDNYTLDITPEDGNGWIKEISTGKIIEYLSTHTFYGLNHEYSTKLLQGFGFNVVIDNWDKKAT